MIFCKYKIEDEKFSWSNYSRIRNSSESFQIIHDNIYHKYDKKLFTFVSCIKERELIIAAIGSNITEMGEAAKILIQAVYNEISESKQQLDMSSLICNLTNTSDSENRMENEEITFRSFESLARQAYRNDYIKDVDEMMGKFGVDGLYYASENMIKSSKTKDEMINKANDIYCNETVVPEIERIYRPSLINKGESPVGTPVHYIIQSDNKYIQKKLITILMQSLYSNNRIHSRRYCTINMENNLDGEDTCSIFNSCIGTAVIVKCNNKENIHNDFASISMSKILNICNDIRHHKNDVLSVICLPRAAEKMKKAILENIGVATIVELREDLLFGEQAKNALRSLAKQANARADRSLYKNIHNTGTGYLYSQLEEQFDLWFNKYLKSKVYPQYADFETANAISQQIQPQGDAYSELSNMIGLDSCKTVINQALDYYKAQKLFKERGMKQTNPAMHMIFTGNPGTAKTSVARLFAKIMRENELLSVGELIEVGRGDLVGQFVGWTAHIVKNKFKEAKGSVLFIDEAYSLVDDRSGSFGDEAINTIVQEMENYREDMVVIFAGYPDKMEGFLDKNPGLRSRIAFHIPFEDYNSNELYEILKFMAENKEIHLADDVLPKVSNILEFALESKDFGNGRFVRNIFEKAMIKQGSRLIKMDVEKLNNKEIATLVADDFDVPYLHQKETARIGF